MKLAYDQKNVYSLAIAGRLIANWTVQSSA